MPALVILIIGLLVGAIFLFSSNNNSSPSNQNPLAPGVFYESNLDPENENNYLPASVKNFRGWYNYTSEIDTSEIEDKKARAEDLRSNIENLNYEIGRLRRNADSYDDDEFVSKLRRLQYEAEDFSSEASDLETDDVVSNLEDTSYNLRRLKNDIESEPSYFYRDRDDDIYSRLRRSEYDTDDALSNIDDFLSDLDDY